MIYTTVEFFKKKTGYDIENLFSSYVFFTANYYQSIINYYNGAAINQEAFNYLQYLKKEVDKVEPLIDQYGEQFNSTDFWELNNNFSDIQTKIESCFNMGRWLRSSRADRFSSNLKISHVQKQNETIERIALDAGYSDPNKWVDISLSNQMIEEDYTHKGGKLLSISLPNNVNFTLDNIIDYLVGDNIYGKDVVKKIEILSDGDLSTVSGRESLRQTFETIMSTVRGSIPEFPQDGVPSEIYGSNENIIQYPIIFRSFLNMIQKDRRFNSLEILDIKKDQDSIFMEFQVSTLTGDTLTNNIII